MSTTRRQLLAAAATLALPAWAKRSKLKIGVTDWNLGLAGKVEAVALAKRIGFAGVEVSLGRKPVNDKLPMDDAALQAEYAAAFRKEAIVRAGTCLDIFHVNGLKNDKLAQRWLADGIRLTRALNAKVMLMPFFGKNALTTREEMDYVGDVLRDFGKEAEKAKILLLLEDTISAEDNVRIMERSRSKAVKTYYDVGNSTSNGFDIIKEMNWLGASRIGQIHLKDGRGFMGEGKIDFVAVMKTIMALGFEGFANLETSNPTKSVENDMKRNLTFIERLLAA